MTNVDPTTPVDEAGHPLWSAVSRARGYCEACRIDRREPLDPYDYTLIPEFAESVPDDRARW